MFAAGICLLAATALPVHGAELPSQQPQPAPPGAAALFPVPGATPGPVADAEGADMDPGQLVQEVRSGPYLFRAY